MIFCNINSVAISRTCWSYVLTSTLSELAARSKSAGSGERPLVVMATGDIRPMRYNHQYNDQQ